MTHVLTRDERNAGYMADATRGYRAGSGYARGRPAVARPISCRAWRRRTSPLSRRSAITSDIPVSSRGRFTLTALDQEALFRPLTKWNTTIDLASELPAPSEPRFGQ